MDVTERGPPSGSTLVAWYHDGGKIKTSPALTTVSKRVCERTPALVRSKGAHATHRFDLRVKLFEIRLDPIPEHAFPDARDFTTIAEPMGFKAYAKQMDEQQRQNASGVLLATAWMLTLPLCESPHQ